MKMICRSIIVGVALLAGSAVAGAADLGSLKDYQPADPVPYSAIHSPARWYLRADVGYAVHDRPWMVENLSDELVQTGWENTWTIGGGVGYYFSQNIRGDITVDHRFASKVSGTNFALTAPFPGATREFDMKNTVVLANLYYDLGDRKWFSPYVGVGLGFTRNTTESGVVVGTVGTIDGKSKTDVAIALMAGFTHELRSGFNLDAGYRFLYLGSADTGDIQGSPVTAEDPHLSHLTAHEFRVGLRYDLGRW